MADEKKPEFEMEYRMLGNTGLKVSALGLGTMSFDSTKMAMELMSAVRDYGVNFFDNAEFYGDPCGVGEKYFGDALKKLQAKDAKKWRRSDLVITTKLFFGCADGQQPNNFGKRSFGPNDLGLSRKHLMEGMKESLERMQLDYVDIIYAHSYDPLTPMEEIVRGFTDIVQSGKAFYWGTSNWSAFRICEAYWVAKVNGLIPPVVEQPQYNMFTRDTVERDFLPLYAEPYKMATTIWSPLAAGMLTGKYLKGIPEDSRVNSRLNAFWGKGMVTEEKNKKVEKLMEIAKEMGVSMVALALGWTIKNKNVTVCMLGGTKASQLEQNKDGITAAQKLDADLMKRIDEILDNKPKSGGWVTRRTKNLTNPL